MEYAGTHLDSLCLLKKKEQGALSTKAQVQSRLFINAFTTQIVSFASVVFFSDVTQKLLECHFGEGVSIW